MKKTSLSQIGDVYGQMLTDLKSELVKEGKVGPGARELNDKNAAKLIKKSGPTAAGGFKAPIQKKDTDCENQLNLDKLSLEEDEETVKIAKKQLNKFMRKSAFDKLFENVMGDDFGGDDELQELGIGDDELGGDDLGGEGEGEDTVTLSLDRTTAQALLDVLSAALGGGEPDGDEGGLDDLGGDEGGLGGDEDNEGFLDEDEETKATQLNTSYNDGKQNRVGNVKPGGGTANTKFTDKVGADGDHGSPLNGAKQPNMGKQNKVGNLKTGQPLFK